ncbi:MAG: NB-ARC domain-containing protein [Chitinophagales bacterium]
MTIPPHHYYEYFIGTIKEVQKIKQVLDKSTRPLVIEGIAGSGKTNLCQAFFEHYEEEYEHRVWIDVVGGNLYYNFFRNDSQLLEALKLTNFSQNQTAAEKKKLLIGAFKVLTGKKLIVIDGLNVNITRIDRNFLLHLQQKANCKLLVNTRHEVKGLKSVKMPKLSFEAAQKIYVQYRDAEKSISLDEITDDDVLTQNITTEEEDFLIEYVDFHPFLLEIMAKILCRDLEITAASLLQLLKNNDLTAIDTDVFVNRNNEEYTLEEHLDISFQLQGLTEMQLDILKQYSLLPSVEIPYFLLKQLLHNPKRDNKLFKETIKELSKLGFLYQKEKIVQMLRPLQIVVNNRYPKTDKHTLLIYRNLMQMCKNAYQNNDLQANTYLAYLETIAENLVVVGRYSEAVEAYQMASQIGQKGKEYAKILTYEYQILNIYEQFCFKKQIEIAMTHHHIALIFVANDKLQQALLENEKGIVILQKHFQADHAILIGFLAWQEKMNNQLPFFEA